MACFHLILVFAAAVSTKILSVDILAFSSFFQVAALHLHDAATLHLPEHMFLCPELPDKKHLQGSIFAAAFDEQCYVPWDDLLQKTYTVDFLKKKRIKNNGEMPQYYVEDDHEAIIPRALFLQVQEEIARRGSQVDCMGRRRGFSAKHCFTGLLYCAECGEQFRRIHWNNRGCKSVVWRCMTRLEKKGACHARTVYEESLKQAFVDALNQLTGGSETYLSIVQENMTEVIEMEQSNLPEEIQRKSDVLQKKLIECAERHEDYEEIAQEIFRLREQKEQALRENVSQQEQKDRMRELQEFLAAQPHHITEFDETLVRHLLAKVTVSFDRLDFTFQSGVAVSIEK